MYAMVKYVLEYALVAGQHGGIVVVLKQFRAESGDSAQRSELDNQRMLGVVSRLRRNEEPPPC